MSVSVSDLIHIVDELKNKVKKGAHYFSCSFELEG